MTSKDKKLNIGDLLLAFRRRIVEALKKDGHKEELTFSQVEVLHLIGPSGKHTMKSIAEHLKITPPSATVLVSEMERKGIVSRVNDPKDRRVVYIALTEKTKKTYLSICKRKEVILERMVSKLTPADRKTLERIIK